MERHDAVEIFSSAVSSVHPAQLLPKHLSLNGDILSIAGQSIPLSGIRNIYVIGAGKAAAAMAIETEKILGNHISAGLVVTKYHHTLPCRRIKIMEAAHPVPDANGVNAVEKTLQLLHEVGTNDVIICLISGGASALWCDLPEGISLHDLQLTFDLLLKSGAAIDEMNIVRKHLSAIKGGQLLRHCRGARVFTLVISDVPGDRLDVIASGPTVADPSTFDDVHGILDKFDLLAKLPTSILTYMDSGKNGTISETPKPGDSLFLHTVNIIVGSNAFALRSAAEKARTLGYQVHAISRLIIGDAETEAKQFVDVISHYRGPKPVCILQGGESTVRVTGRGKGGRNQHFALCVLREMQSRKLAMDITVVSGGTDGSDGPTDATGAIADQKTLLNAETLGLDINEYIEQNDAYHFFMQTDGLIITGPTQTNVMDIIVAVIK